MPEKYLLKNYPKVKGARQGTSLNRSIHHRIIASYRGIDFFDGDRLYGYGGLKQDGRWDLVVPDFVREYNLANESSILQINCEKGFFLNSFHKVIDSINLVGIESSDYAIANTYNPKNYALVKSNIPMIPFDSNRFDLVISLGNVYVLTLQGAINHLKEISRVCKKSSFITLATYKNENQYWAFKNWSLLATLILKREEWIEIMQEADYDGDYQFIDSEYLNL